MRLIDYFDRGAALFPDQRCLHAGTKGWTYKEVPGQTHRVANGLLAAGLKRGTKAAVYSPNHAAESVDFIASLPRSPVGKVLKKDLRGPYWAGRERKI